MAAAVAVATGAVGCAPVPLGNRNTYHNQSEGMAPTLHVNDIVAGTKNVGTLRRGDIIVFEGPPGAVPTKGLRLIKRVVGLPGETVEGKDGTILVNSKRLDEWSYLPPDVRSRDFPPETVPDDLLWVLGDNRQDSRDSTFFKSIPKKSVVLRLTRITAPKSRRHSIPRATYPTS